jgi:hypothetical protein
MSYSSPLRGKGGARRCEPEHVQLPARVWQSIWSLIGTVSPVDANDKGGVLKGSESVKKVYALLDCTKAAFPCG